MDILTAPWMGGLLVPLIILGLGGAIKWALHGGKYPRRDFFLLGIEFSLTAITLSFTNIFDWFRRIINLPNSSQPDYFEVLLYLLQLLAALAALLVVLGVMRHYIDGLRRNPLPIPIIGWGRWCVINGIGGAPLGFTVFLLV